MGDGFRWKTYDYEDEPQYHYCLLNGVGGIPIFLCAYYEVSKNPRALEVARRPLERNGIEPREVSSGGGSDANAFRRNGFEALLFANGTEANHTADESVDATELDRMLAVCLTAVEEAAALCSS